MLAPPSELYKWHCCKWDKEIEKARKKRGKGTFATLHAYGENQWSNKAFGNTNGYVRMWPNGEQTDAICRYAFRESGFATSNKQTHANIAHL